MLTVDVPLNTMLADLDETLRGLLKDELERHGFEGVDIAFDAPSREWSGQLSKPTVNIFLYDLREAEALRTSEWSRMTARRAHASRAARRWSWSAPTRSRRGRRPSRTSTGCSRRCSRSSSPTRELPQDALNGRLANGSQAVADQGPHRPGQGREVGLLERGRRPVQGVAGLRRAALGGVRRPARARARRSARRPSARALSDGPPRAVARDAPLRRPRAATRRASRWPTSGSRCPDVGTWTSSDADGRFRFDRLPPGTPPAARAHGRRPGGRRAARGSRQRASTW